MPHAASLLSFLVASLRPDLITNDSLKLAPDYVMVAAKMAAPASPANSSACLLPHFLALTETLAAGYLCAAARSVPRHPDQLRRP